MCVAATVKIPHIIPQATELDPGIDIPLVRLPARNRACVFLKLCSMDRQLRVVVRVGIERDPAIFAQEIALQKAALHACQSGNTLLMENGDSTFVICCPSKLTLSSRKNPLTSSVSPLDAPPTFSSCP